LDWLVLESPIEVTFSGKTQMASWGNDVNVQKCCVESKCRREARPELLERRGS
jgi:hypothetical protein